MLFETRTAHYPVIEMNDTEYFVVGRCTSGSRHYSERLSLSQAFKVFDKYCGLVEYFGGGETELIAVRRDVTVVVRRAVA